MTCSCQKQLHQNVMVANFEIRSLFASAATAQTATGSLGVTVAILFTIHRRLNPAPLSPIAGVPPAAVRPYTSHNEHQWSWERNDR